MDTDYIPITYPTAPVAPRSFVFGIYPRKLDLCLRKYGILVSRFNDVASPFYYGTTVMSPRLH